MALTPITVEELRDRLDILDVVGGYTRLQKAGAEYRGLCPFHDDHKPSLDVNPAKGLWICRVENIGGDIFDFVQKAENLDFVEAAEMLANRLGFTIARSSPERSDERSRLYDVCRLAADLYERALWHSTGGEVARDYLARRGIDEETARRFRLGYAPAGWDKLAARLERGGVPPRDAEQAGLLKARERGDGYYDRFRHRLMFPILDRQGRCVGFGGRVLRAEDEPKYLNSAESPVFSKGRLFYAPPGKWDALADGVLVVEGYMDVIGLCQHGIQNAVATLGTALTREHLKLLQRYTEKVVLCYDADSAGTRASDRAAALFVEEGVDARVLTLPAGRDPDEYVQEHGAEAFRSLAAEAPDLIDYRLATAMSRAGDDEAQRFEAVRESMVAVLGEIGDELRRADAVRRAADWWSARSPGLQESLERTLARDLEQYRRRARGRGPAAEPYRGRRTREYYTERQYLARVLAEAGLLDQDGCAVPLDWLTDPLCRRVYEVWRGLEHRGTEALLAELEPEARALVAELLCDDAPATAIEPLVGALRVQGLAAEAARLRRERASLPDTDDQALEIQREIASLNRQIEESRRQLLGVPGGLR